MLKVIWLNMIFWNPENRVYSVSGSLMTFLLFYSFSFCLLVTSNGLSVIMPSVIMPSVFVTQVCTYECVRSALYARRPFNFSGTYVGKTAKWLGQLLPFTSHHRARSFPIGFEPANDPACPAHLDWGLRHWTSQLKRRLYKFWVSIVLLSPILSGVDKTRQSSKHKRNDDFKLNDE